MKPFRCLYNVMLPLWLLLVMPQLWGVSLALSLVVDIVVLFVAMKYYALRDIRGNMRRCILKVWISGLVADFAGVLLAVGMTFLPMWLSNEGVNGSWWVNEVAVPMLNRPTETLPGFLGILLCVGVSAALIYLLNYKWALRRLDADDRLRGRVAVAMTLFTTPYLFFLPTID